MKKLALASAIVATTMTSMGTHATPMVGMGSVGIYTGWNWDPITVPCAITRNGGADGMVLDNAAGTLSGTICLDPTGTGGPFVMLSISMSGGATMNKGAIQISTDYATTNAWAVYNVVDVPTNSISCTSSGGTPKLSCAATLLGKPAILNLN